jgi:hypothetical protein
LISGTLVPNSGALFRASVHFPEIGESLAVTFLADTGAGISCLMPEALGPLPLSAQARLAAQLRPGIPLYGIGGITSTYETPAIVIFDHTDGSSSEFVLKLSLIADRRYRDVPSMLGRDVLFRGQLSAGRDGVTWDVELGEHDLTA